MRRLVDGRRGEGGAAARRGSRFCRWRCVSVCFSLFCLCVCVHECTRVWTRTTGRLPAGAGTHLSSTASSASPTEIAPHAAAGPPGTRPATSGGRRPRSLSSSPTLPPRSAIGPTATAVASAAGGSGGGGIPAPFSASGGGVSTEESATDGALESAAAPRPADGASNAMGFPLTFALRAPRCLREGGK